MEEEMGNLNDVYIIADNIISSLGFTTEENLQAIRSGKSGIVPVEAGRVSDAPMLAGLIDANRLNKLAEEHKLQKFSKIEQLVLLSIKDIASQREIDLKECGLLISTTKGSIDLLSHHTEAIDRNVFLRISASKIASYFGMDDNATVVSNACISGVSALITGRRLLLNNNYKHLIVTGVDVLSAFITSGFRSFRSLSAIQCKPYDRERDGLNLGEGCGSILLSAEHETDSIILRGGAISNDANHISGPSRTGDGLYYAMKGAMDEAGVTPQDVDYLNLHGTATVFNDEMEAKAVFLAQLEETPVNSLKPYFGHTLGASGLIETIICAHQLKENIVYGTPGYRANGVSLPLKVNSHHVYGECINTCIKTASGFGGCNAAVILSKLPSRKLKEQETCSFREIKRCVIESGSITVNDEIQFNSAAADFPLFIREAYKKTNDGNQKFYKMDDLCKLGYVAALHLLNGMTFSPDEMGIVLSNFASSLDTDTKHQRIIDEGGDSAASPTVFVYTLANIVAGEICIRHKIQGENTFFIDYPGCSEKQEEYVKLAMTAGKLNYCITGWCEYFDTKYKAEFKLIQKEKRWKS